MSEYERTFSGESGSRPRRDSSQDRWEQLEIEMMKRRSDAARVRIAELALWNGLPDIDAQKRVNDIDDHEWTMEVPD